MRLGVIGYGRRIHAIVNQLVKCDSRCQVVAIADLDKERAMQGIQEAQLPIPRCYGSADEMLASETFDGILIGTRCALHAEMAMKVLPLGIPIFLEKPVATTMADWDRLSNYAKRYRSPVVVSFPLRYTPLVQMAKELLDSGKIGKVEHVQAVNNVTYGGTYYHGWYRDEKETGGLFLQKTTHDFDYIQYLLGERPISLCAVKSKQVFKGDKPAMLRCSACGERACEERVVPEGSVPDRENDYCCFAVDTGNEDSSSAIVTYESGMHMSYSQNFFVRRQAAARGARLIGYKGTIEFDFYTGRLEVHYHHKPVNETHCVRTDEPHFGGDPVLAQNFIDVVVGRDIPRAGLQDGLLSALMCLHARSSSETHEFMHFVWE